MDVRNIAVDPGPEATFYALGDALYRSRDRGVTWEAVSNIRLDLLVVEPGNPNVLYASRSLPERAVLKSTDGGVTWSEVVNGLPAFRWLYLRTAGPGHVYGTEQNEVYETTDGAATWRRVSQGVSGISALTVDPTNVRRLYVSVSINGAVLRSDDGGVTWTRGVGSDGHPKESIAVNPHDPNRVYAAASCCAQLFKSVDLGRTWTSLRAPASEVRDVIVSPWGSVIVSTGPGPTVLGGPYLPAGIFQSFDGGGTWQPLNSGLEPQSLRRLLLTSDGRHLLGLRTFGAGTLVYEFGQTPTVPDLSDGARVLLAALLALLGFVAARTLGARGKSLILRA